MIELSHKVDELVDRLFSSSDCKEVRQLLETECAENISFCENSDKFDMERIRISVLKLSDGKMDKLIEAIVLAQTDWRDLFMAAGFGEDIYAHEKWFLENKKII